MRDSSIDSINYDLYYNIIEYEKMNWDSSYSPSFDWSFVRKVEKDSNLTAEKRFEIYNVYAIYLESVDSMDAALDYQFKILDEIEKNKELTSRFEFTSTGNIGAIYQTKGNCFEALKYYHLAVKSIQNISRYSYDNLQKIYTWISECHYDLEQYDSSRHYLLKVNQTIIDSEQAKHNNAITEIEEKFKNRELQYELKEKSDQYYRKIALALATVGTLTFILFTLSLRYRNTYLSKQNLSIQLDNVQKSAELRALNAELDGEEKERGRIAHLLHDQISGSLAAVKFQLSTLDDHEGKLAQPVQLIQAISRQIRSLSHKLFPSNLDKNGLQNAIKDIAELYSNGSLTIDVVRDSASWEFDRDKTLKIYNIINELLTNVIKHSQASTAVVIFSSTEEYYKIKVEDNGIGIQENEEDDGHGLTLIKSRMKNWGGKFEYINKTPGSIFQIYFPKNKI